MCVCVYRHVCIYIYIYVHVCALTWIRLLNFYMIIHIFTYVCVCVIYTRKCALELRWISMLDAFILFIPWPFFSAIKSTHSKLERVHAVYPKVFSCNSRIIYLQCKYFDRYVCVCVCVSDANRKSTTLCRTSRSLSLFSHFFHFVMAHMSMYEYTNDSICTPRFIKLHRLALLSISLHEAL